MRFRRICSIAMLLTEGVSKAASEGASWTQSRVHGRTRNLINALFGVYTTVSRGAILPGVTMSKTD